MTQTITDLHVYLRSIREGERTSLSVLAGLTPAGLRLEAHALAILSSWEQARQEIALPHGYQTLFRLGGPVSLWSSLLRPWLSSMRERAPEAAR